MKKYLISACVILLGGVMFSCNLLDSDKEETDPDQTLGKPGNYWKGTATGYPEATATVSQNNDGNVVASLSYGGNTYQVEGKVTSEGIYDYVYSNGDRKKPFPLVKFDAKVGDKWEFNIGNQKVVREVVRKSTEDDTPYIFWMIKTIDVEETIPAGLQVKGGPSQASKILWKFNHKFGFISATVTRTNGQQVTVRQTDTNAAD